MRLNVECCSAVAGLRLSTVVVKLFVFVKQCLECERTVVDGV